MHRKNTFLLSLPIAFFISAPIGSPAPARAAPPGAVLTYHDDNFRTGWQQQETVLTSSNFPPGFGIVQQVPLKDQIDAQPLVASGLTVNGGKDIAVAADESNNVYEIDPATGTILKQRNFGTPVPRPFGCGNNGPNVGITSTPVIDWPSQTLFLIAYVKGSPPSYQLHALDLNTLLDKVPPLTVAASHKLSDGSVYAFNAAVQRQRPGLLLSNGTIYAGFGSFCDYSRSTSRGWILGWKWNAVTPSLTPLGGAPEPGRLTDADVICPSFFPCSSTKSFLNAVWMSGYGIAADQGGNVYFTTSNSDGASATSSSWDGTNNIQESVVELSSGLTSVLGIFSPNSAFGAFAPNTLQMDKSDNDLGSGGVLAVPPLSSHNLAVVAGKDGRMFLFDRTQAGGNKLKLLQMSKGPGCWCGPSYFAGPDGVGRVVSSQGNQVRTWQVIVASSPPSLFAEGTAAIATGQDPGFFTTVSCNTSGIAYGKCAPGTAIIWAVAKPAGGSTALKLYAFSAMPGGGKYSLLFGPAQAGSWPNLSANANVVPTVSNGRVYVASNKLLTIFGASRTSGTVAAASLSEQPAAALDSTYAISGVLVGVNGTALTFQNRNGKNRQIDASGAIKNERLAAALIEGESFTAVGSSFTPAGSLRADAIYRAKGSQGSEWPPDKDPGQ